MPEPPPAIPVAGRIGGFVYAIRNIVTEARKVEAAGRNVRYLNIGDPITFGFETPPHLIEAVERAMRDGHNGYAPSVGILAAREAVAARVRPPRHAGHARSRGDHVGHVGGDRAGADRAGRERATKCSFRCRPIRCTRRCWPRSARARCFTGPIPIARLAAGCRSRPQPGHPRNARARRHRPEQPDRRDLSGRRTPRAGRSRRSPQLPAARRRGLRRSRLRRPRAGVGGAQPGRAGHFVFVAVEGVSGAGLARRLDGGRPQRSRWTTCSAAIKKLADGRLCATGPMEYAIVAALNGDRSHQETFRAALQRTRRVDDAPPQRHRRDHGSAADRGVLRDAAKCRCRRA